MNLQSADFGPLQENKIQGVAELSTVSRSVLRGCNSYFDKTVILEQIDLGSFAGQAGARDREKFADRFAELFLTLPTLIDPPKRTQEFCRLLAASDCKVANVLLEAIVAVEQAAAAVMHRLDSVEFAELYEAGEDGHVVACWATKSPKLSTQCAEIAIAGVNVLLREELGLETGQARGRYDSLLEDLVATARSRRLTTTVCVIREAAKKRNIDCAYLGTSYLRLGQGKHQLYFRASLTGKTSHTASQLSINKRLATRTLRAQRLPVPRQLHGKDAETVQRAADTIGYPVIIKPLKGYGGHGVAMAKGPEDVAGAYDYASAGDRPVVVEEFIEGDYVRLLVIGNEFVAALRVSPPEVTGDGHRSIRDLVNELNDDPFRDGFRLIKVELDERLAEYLGDHDLDFDSVLPCGETIALREIANVSQGGYSIDITDDVHPDYADAAVRAAQAIRLDVAGIDFITRDINRSYRDVGGAIIEVNSRPGLGMHAFPRFGQSRDIGEAILNGIYPPGDCGSVSATVIVGQHRTAVVARDLDEILRLSNRSVGLAIRNKAYVNGARCDLGSRKHIRAIRSLVRDPSIDTLISTQAPAGIIRRGLQLDRVGIAAVRAPAPDADLEVYREALAVLMKATPDRIVCGVRNDLAMQAFQGLERKQITLVTRSGFTRRIRKHLALGGHAVIAVWAEGRRHIEIYEGETLVASIPAIPKPTLNSAEAELTPANTVDTGHRSHRIDTRLYAIAMALGSGVSVEQIRESLHSLPIITR